MGNEKVISDGIGLARTIIRKRYLQALKDTAYDLTNLTDVAVWTHNLWDSIGCGIYENGTLIEYAVPPRVATDPRSGADDYPPEARKDPSSAMPIFKAPNSVDKGRAYWGQDELFDMLNDPPAEIKSSFGFALYYVAAMPYAQYVDRKYMSRKKK
jgi:hypothetical protein